MQQRLFTRVLFTAKSTGTLDGVILTGKIENISLNGAMISFENGINFKCGDNCFLTIYPEGESYPIRIIAEVVRFLRNMVGIKFVTIDDENQRCLYELVKRVATEPENMDEQRERMKQYFANYFASS